ncbi:MAG: hypothetical protein IPK13_15585 [Deltaproteobacteria bacterium]|nr:hypothetical protein [Deltaproteobacteria bacterium]
MRCPVVPSVRLLATIVDAHGGFGRRPEVSTPSASRPIGLPFSHSALVGRPFGRAACAALLGACVGLAPRFGLAETVAVTGNSGSAMTMTTTMTRTAGAGSAAAGAPPSASAHRGNETEGVERGHFAAALTLLPHVQDPPRQNRFTVCGTPRGPDECLLSETGAFSARPGSPVLVATLEVEGPPLSDRTLTKLGPTVGQPANQRLVDGYLPIPQVIRNAGGPVELKVTGFVGSDETPAVSYEVRNTSAAPQRAIVRVAVLPFDTNPEWQAGRPGSRVPIDRIQIDRMPVDRMPVAGPILRVNDASIFRFSRDAERITAVTGIDPSNIEQATFHEAPVGLIADPKGDGTLGVAFQYNFELPPGQSQSLTVSAPKAASTSAATPDATSDATSAATARMKRLDLPPSPDLEQAIEMWRELLGRSTPTFEGPPEVLKLASHASANIAQILVNADGPVLMPGSRAYARPWIRDGVVMASALLQAGFFERAREFIDWYLKLEHDGFVPSGYEHQGEAFAIEHDSHGELLWIIGEYFRFTHDRAFLDAAWPAVQRIVDNIERLRRAPTSSPQSTQPEADRCGDLMPKSISHEGYPRPVCANWDNYWTLAGLQAAAELARRGNRPEAARFDAIRKSFSETLSTSIRADIEDYRLSYVPGSDRGDPDPSAVPIALTVADAMALLPEKALRGTFEPYLQNLKERVRGRIKHVYAPYEVRIVEALVRLGQRDEALMLLDFLHGDQRPREWAQFTEIVYPDPDKAAFMGDAPHTWIGAEAVRATRGLFVYEAGGALVLAAGVPQRWLDAEGTAETLRTRPPSLSGPPSLSRSSFLSPPQSPSPSPRPSNPDERRTPTEIRNASGLRVLGLPTHFGLLSYALEPMDSARNPTDSGGAWRVRLEGQLAPPNGILVKPPAGVTIGEVTLNGRVTPFSETPEGYRVAGESFRGTTLSEAISSMASQLGGKRNDGDNTAFEEAIADARAQARAGARKVASATGIDPEVLVGRWMQHPHERAADEVGRLTHAARRLRGVFDPDVVSKVFRELGPSAVHALAQATSELEVFQKILGRRAVNDAFRIKPHSAPRVAEGLKKAKPEDIGGYVSVLARVLGGQASVQDFYRNNPYSFFEILEARGSMSSREFDRALPQVMAALAGTDLVLGRKILLEGIKTTGWVGALLPRHRTLTSLSARYGKAALTRVFHVDPEFLVPVLNALDARAQRTHTGVEAVLDELEALLGPKNVVSFLDNPGKVVFLGQIVDELDTLSQLRTPSIREIARPHDNPDERVESRGSDPHPNLSPNPNPTSESPERVRARQSRMSDWLHAHMHAISTALHAARSKS